MLGAMYKLLYLTGHTYCSPEIGLAETTLKILWLFHHILHYIVHNSRITVTKMQYRVHLLVDNLYNIIIHRKNSEY